MEKQEAKQRCLYEALRELRDQLEIEAGLNMLNMLHLNNLCTWRKKMYNK